MANIIKRSGNWFIDQLNVYQAANSDIASIKNNFLVRMDEFRMIIDAMKSKADNDPLQHELILGRRGSGKSTLLKRIEIEIQEDKELSKKFIPINLAEEQAGIYRLFDLWEQVLSELSFKFKIALQLKDFKSFDSENNYARYVFEEIHKLCSDLHVKVVLLLDNFDRIAENMDDNGNLLRELLINYNDVQIIAGSTRMDEYFWAYDKPFYEFFRRHKLEALSREEIRLLLNHWADTLELPELKTFIENNPGKLENIRLLTDGLPRTLQFFIQMVLQKEGADSYEYLKKIMDTVSPLYQERLNHLPPPQRKLVLEIAFFWEACSTKQLAEKAKMESKLVSAQLKQLEQKGIIDKIETDSKNHLYRLSERFFNLWLIITQGSPEQKRKAKWLSIFLENFYDETTVKQLCSVHIEKLKSNILEWSNALILTKALAQSKYISTSERDELISLTEKMRNKSVDNSYLLLPKEFKVISKEIEDDVLKEKYDNALMKIEEIENESDGAKEVLKGFVYLKKLDFQKAESSYTEAISKGQNVPSVNLGITYFGQAKYELAEKFLIKGLKNYENEYFAYALGLCYIHLKKYELAGEYFSKTIENGTEISFIIIAKYFDDGDIFESAEKYYLLAIEKGSSIAIIALAKMYERLEKFDLAKEYYQLGIEKGNGLAALGIANMYNKQGKFELAEKYFVLALEKGESAAIMPLAHIYFKTNRFELAKKFYQDAVADGQKRAFLYLGLLYHHQKYYEKAEEYYKLGIKSKQERSEYALAVLYYECNKQKTEALRISMSSKMAELDKIEIEIWNGVFSNTEERICKEFKVKELLELDSFLKGLLIHQQQNLVLNLFNNPEFGKTLQEKYTVIYYATLLLTKQGDKNLELKIPPELNEPIQDLLKHIHEKEIFYGYKRD